MGTRTLGVHPIVPWVEQPLRNNYIHTQTLNGAGVFTYIYPQTYPNVDTYTSPIKCLG